MQAIVKVYESESDREGRGMGDATFTLDDLAQFERYAATLSVGAVRVERSFEQRGSYTRMLIDKGTSLVFLTCYPL